MILAYVTICLLNLFEPGNTVCAPEKTISDPSFDTEKECWAAVDAFMHEFTAMGSGVSLAWKCGEDT
jgi:hypothetical protein